MALLLTLISAIAWTCVYVDAVRIGFRDRTYAMPIAALGLNIAWEWLYAVHGIATEPAGVQTWVNLAWGLADVLILITFFRYGRSELPAMISRAMFVAGGLGIVIMSVIVQVLFVVEFDFGPAAVYSAFLQNLLMSGLFIGLFVARRGSRGQSLLIAVAKWLGTLAPTVLFGVLRGSDFVIGIGALCTVLDLVYVGLLVRGRRQAVPAVPEQPASDRPAGDQPAGDQPAGETSRSAPA